MCNIQQTDFQLQQMKLIRINKLMKKLVIPNGIILLFEIKRLKFVKNTLRKVIEYILKVVLKQGNGVMTKGKNDTQQKLFVQISLS